MCLPFSLLAQIPKQEFGANTALRTETEVAQIADNWWQRRPKTKDTAQPILCADTLNRAYLFSRGREFLLVSSSTTDPEILGYGTCQSPRTPMPVALKQLLVSRPPSRAAGSAAYPPVGANWRAVSPLLTTVRHQKDPYNRLCPYYRHADGTLHSAPCVVGCVATAMEQILTYYRRTYTLRDTLKGWETEHYRIPDVAPGVSIDTRQILDNYDTQPATEAQIDAVARCRICLV